MRKQLTGFFLVLGVLGLLVASVQAQPNPAIVTMDGVFVGIIAVDDDTGITSTHFSDLDLLLCYSGCGDCAGVQDDEEIRYHSVETFSSNLNVSITGPIYTLVSPDPGASQFCINLGWGRPHLSWTQKNHGKNTERLTIGGTLDTLPFICPSGYLDFNLVVNHKGMKGPRIECVEPD